jgi:hypothetical protein
MDVYGKHACRRTSGSFTDRFRLSRAIGCTCAKEVVRAGAGRGICSWLAFFRVPQSPLSVEGSALCNPGRPQPPRRRTPQQKRLRGPGAFRARLFSLSSEEHSDEESAFSLFAFCSRAFTRRPSLYANRRTRCRIFSRECICGTGTPACAGSPRRQRV